MNNKKTNINIKDIAKIAGVSITTVSHALSGNRYVKEKTKKKIFEIIKKYNYEPNITARSLSKKESRMVGVITTELNNEFYSEIIEGVEETLSPRGYILVINSSNYDRKKESSIFRKLDSLFIDGLILVGGSSDFGHITDYNNRNIPVILINRESSKSNLPKIIVDYRKAMRDITDYLFKIGHKNIGYIGWCRKGELIAQDKFEGYLESLRKNNCKKDDNIIMLLQDFMADGYNNAYDLMKSYLKEENHKKNPGFSALVCQTDHIALGAIAALKKETFKIPQNVSVSGFGDISLGRFSEPSLTTISIPKREMGRLGADIFLKKYNGMDIEEIDTILETELLVRNSTTKI